MDRRRLITLALASIASHGSMAGLAAADDEWNETFDVVVIGSGYAGLAAAIEAREAGASVLLVEKMESLGGNSVLSTGDMAVPGSSVQAGLGITGDSPELMMRDLLALGKTNDPVRCRVISEGALEAWLWTIHELGVHWVPDALQKDEGQSIPRACMVANRSGTTIVAAEINHARKIDVAIRTSTKFLEFVMDDEGIAGVTVLSDYHFPDDGSGIRRRIRARRGVVLCTGGFGADVAFRKKLDPRLGENFPTDNQPGATAEGLLAARKAGARLVDLDHIQVLTWIGADEIGIGNAWSFIEHVASPFGIWINDKGERFVNERGLQEERSRATVDEIARGGRVYAIVDASGFDRSGNTGRRLNDWRQLIRRGIVRRYETLDDLCDDVRISGEKFADTLSEFNRNVLNGSTDRLGRGHDEAVRPLSTAPWYLIEIQPKVHYCMGGVTIDEKARVVSETDGKPIPGLFAAGEVTGGTFGQERAPCHSLTDALVTGRIAGREAANRK